MRSPLPGARWLPAACRLGKEPGKPATGRFVPPRRTAPANTLSIGTAGGCSASSGRGGPVESPCNRRGSRWRASTDHRPRAPVRERRSASRSFARHTPARRHAADLQGREPPGAGHRHDPRPQQINASSSAHRPRPQEPSCPTLGDHVSCPTGRCTSIPRRPGRRRRTAAARSRHPEPGRS